MQILVMRPSSSDADVEIRDAQGRIVGRALGINPLAHEPDVVARAIADAPGDLVLLWSGWMGDDRSERSVRNWGPAAWAALEALVDALETLLEAVGDTKRVLLRPVARGVLSDAQRCRKMFSERSRRRVGLALEPCAFMEAAMLAQIEDHLTRAFDALSPLAGAVVLGNLQGDVDSPEEDAPLRPSPVQSGIISPPLLGVPAHELAGSGMPVILITEDLPGALASLAWEQAIA